MNPMSSEPRSVNREPRTGTANRTTATPNAEPEDATVCPSCGETNDLAKVKGCIKCLKCGFKFDCNGW
jgi:ribosomal protein L37AE/L43A